MSGIKPKLTIYAKQENMTDDDNKNQSIKTDAELMKMAELAAKSIKIVIKTAFHLFKKLGR